MAIAKVGTLQTDHKTQEDTTDTYTIDLSGLTLTEDNIVLICIGAGAGDTTAPPIKTTAESGMTLIGEGGNAGANNSQCTVAAFWYLVPASPPTDFDIDNSAGANESITVWMQEFSGVDTVAPIHDSVFDQTEAGSVTDFDIPGLTTTEDGCFGVAFAAIKDATDGPYTTSGTGWTEEGNYEQTPFAWEAGGVYLTQAQASAGATGAANVDADAANTIEAAGAQIWLEPAAAGGAGAEIFRRRIED